MTEPKYDEDVVNLGYLKKIVSDSDGNLENIYLKVSKHYGSKPQPPYNKGDTWIDGDIVYTCINSRQIGVYTDSDWVTESGAKVEAGEKNKVFLRQPSNYNAGDMWILQSDNDHRAGKKGEILITTAGRAEYDEGDWVNMLGYGSIRSINEVADNLNNAINRIGNVEEAIEDGIIITFYQDNEPEGKHIGDLWYVTGEVEGYTQGKIYRYDGTSWIILDDPAIQKAFEEANEARIVADGKIQSFYSETEPVQNMGVGDLWIDIANNNQLYRYNGTNWVAVYDTRVNELVVNVESVTERVATIETDLGEIDLKVEENTTKVTTIQDEVNNITNTTSSSEGKNIHIEDSAEEPLVEISLHGESTQEGTPTPDNSIEIQNIEGNVAVKVTGKNLFDINNAFNYGNVENQTTINNDGTITTISNFSSLRDIGTQLFLEKNTDYIISLFVNSITSTGTRLVGVVEIIEYDANDNYISRLASSEIRNIGQINTFTFNSGNCEKWALAISGWYGSAYSGTLTYSNIQVEEGTVVTEYEEYKTPQKVTFPLAEGQKLYEGSYLADDGIHHTRKQYTFTGNETFVISIENNNYIRLYSPIFADALKNGGYESIDKFICTHFEQVSDYNTSKNCIALNEKRFYITISKAIVTDVTTFKTLLAEQYANGTPVIVEYELAEEEIIPYTEEQQEAWNNIKALKTYKNVTNITSDAYARIIYMRDNGLDVYETKQNAEKQYTETTKKIAEQNITVNGILSQVSEATSSINTINNNLTELNERTASTELTLNEYKINFDERTKTIDENLQENIEKVNNMSYTFNTDDLKIAKEDDPVNARINNTGMRVYSYNELKAIFNHNGSGIQKLIVVGSAQIGNLQVIKGVDENGQACTDFHHLVSNIQELTDLEVD